MTCLNDDIRVTNYLVVLNKGYNKSFDVNKVRMKTAINGPKKKPNFPRFV